MRSYALRSAVVSATTSALVLIAFAGAAWWKLREARMVTLDRQIEETGGELALSARWGLIPEGVELRIDERFGRERSRGRAYAISYAGKPHQFSSTWPADLKPDALPRSSDVIERSLPLRPGGLEPRDGPRDRYIPPPDGEDRGDRNRRRPPHENGEKGPPPNDAWPDRGGGPLRDRLIKPRLFRPVFYTATAGGREWRVGVFGHAESGTVIRLALDLDIFAADLDASAHSFLLALPGALMLIAAGAWIAARRSLAPVQRLSGKFENLTLAGANERIDPMGADREFGSIITSYNQMLDRLERSYRQATRFSADASHELKTPLAVMRATVERGLQECPDGSAEQRTYAGLLDELDQLQAIIESLLLLSRADAGLLATSRESFDFSHWLQPLMEDAGLMAEERGITLHTETAPGITIKADPVLLYRAIHNLLRNAVAYNHDGGTVHCRLTTDAGEAVFTIANTGDVIPEAEQEHIFERFMRGTNGGGSGSGRGLGIGLSLSREIASAHGGSLTLLPPRSGETSFELRIPRVIA